MAIAHRDDCRHSDAARYYRDFLSAGGVPVTTDYLLSETISLLRSRTTVQGTATFIESILSAAQRGRILIERIGEERWLSAWHLSKKFADKPQISFPDFTSFVVMKELGLSEALTSDHHFEVVGMGFKKLF